MYTTTEVIVWQPYNHVHVYMLLYKLLRPTKKSVIHLTFASCNVLHNKPSLTDSSILETFILQTLSFIPEEPEFFFHFKFFIEICNLSDYNMELCLFMSVLKKFDCWWAILNLALIIMTRTFFLLFNDTSKWFFFHIFIIFLTYATYNTKG